MHFQVLFIPTGASCVLPLPPCAPGGPEVTTTIIIIVVVVVVVVLIIFIVAVVVAVVIAVYCLCFRDGGKAGNSKHWTDSSGSHSMPREQQSERDVRDICVCNLG